MEKEKQQLIFLEDWTLRKKEEKVQAHGNVVGHPRLADGSSIHTSPVLLMNYLEDKKELRLETYSGSRYSLPLWQAQDSHMLKELFPQFGLQPEIAEEVAGEKARKLEEVRGLADRLLDADEAYLCCAGFYVRFAYYKNAEGSLEELGDETSRLLPGIPPREIVVGTGSRVVASFEKSPGTPSFISRIYLDTGLKRLWVENNGSCDFYICGKTELWCPPGEMVAILPEDSSAASFFAPFVDSFAME